MDLAIRIRTARRKSGMSQQAMAEQVGVTRGAVANWESAGHVRPSRMNLYKVAAVTGVRIEWLARGHGSMMPLSLSDAISNNEPLVASSAVEIFLLSVFRLASESDKSLIMEAIDSAAKLLD